MKNFMSRQRTILKSKFIKPSKVKVVYVCSLKIFLLLTHIPSFNQVRTADQVIVILNVPNLSSESTLYYYCNQCIEMTDKFYLETKS